MKIAVISDIHEDIVSLTKALKMIDLEKCSQVVCLGDILGYPFLRARYEKSRNAAECIALIKKYCSIVVPGNHDLHHIQKFPLHANGFQFPANWFHLPAEEKTRISHNKVWNYSDDYSVSLCDKDKAYISSLPELALKQYGDIKVLFSHYFYPNFTGYVSSQKTEKQNTETHFGYMRDNNCQVSIFGHLHIEGAGICYEKGVDLFSGIFNGFNYYSFGEVKLKAKKCCVTVPGVADNGQVNGFAIFDTVNFTIQTISLNTNRRFIW